jgi:hypothetical protein
MSFHLILIYDVPYMLTLAPRKHEGDEQSFKTRQCSIAITNYNYVQDKDTYETPGISPPN